MYKTIKNKTYHNIMYLANLIKQEKGYPIREAAQIALDHFDNDDTFRYHSVSCMMNNLVTYQEHLQRVAIHEYNMSH